MGYVYKEYSLYYSNICENTIRKQEYTHFGANIQHPAEAKP